jgi:hypothetical protein
MGINVATIEDPKTKKRPSVDSSSDLKALSSPSFAVTQALVGLLAQNAVPKAEHVLGKGSKYW